MSHLALCHAWSRVACKMSNVVSVSGSVLRPDNRKMSFIRGALCFWIAPVLGAASFANEIICWTAFTLARACLPTALIAVDCALRQYVALLSYSISQSLQDPLATMLELFVIYRRRAMNEQGKVWKLPLSHTCRYTVWTCRRKFSGAKSVRVYCIII